MASKKRNKGKGKSKRPRAERRERERQLRKEIRRRKQLEAAAPGGSPGRALPVASVSMIELRVRSTPCFLCGGDLELTDVEARSTDAGLRRVARAHCRRCHAERELWFAVSKTIN